MCSVSDPWAVPVCSVPLGSGLCLCDLGPGLCFCDLGPSLCKLPHSSLGCSCFVEFWKLHPGPHTPLRALPQDPTYSLAPSSHRLQ